MLFPIAYIANRKFKQGQSAWRPILRWCGIVFSIMLFTFLDAWLYRDAGISFTTEFLRGSAMPLVVFIAGCVIGMAWEYMGQFALDSWHYPSVRRHPRLLGLLPIFWGTFMLIMQNGYAIARIEGLGSITAALVSTAILGLLIEGINLFTGSWVYTGWSSSIPLLVIGWLALLSFTFVLGFNAFFINPFGL
jgi:hypothetical protein